MRGPSPGLIRVIPRVGTINPRRAATTTSLTTTTTRINMSKGRTSIKKCGKKAKKGINKSMIRGKLRIINLKVKMNSKIGLNKTRETKRETPVNINSSNKRRKNGLRMKNIQGGNSIKRASSQGRTITGITLGQKLKAVMSNNTTNQIIIKSKFSLIPECQVEVQGSRSVF